LGVISENKEDSPIKFEPKYSKKIGVFDKKFTKKALMLINENKLDIEIFKKFEIVTESDVLNIIRKSDYKDVDDLIDDIYKNNKTVKVAIIGGGRGAVQVIDLIKNLLNFRAVFIYDDTDSKQNKKIMGIPIIGRINFNEIKKNYQNNSFDYLINSVSTSISFRKKCFESAKKYGIPFTNLIHRSAYIGSNIEIGMGNIILPFVHIGPCTIIGNDNFISAKCSIEHHNKIGNHCTFGPGVMTSSDVEIGSEVKFGTGIFVEPFIRIGSNSIISSGSIITNHVIENKVVFSNLKMEQKDKLIR